MLLDARVPLPRLTEVAGAELSPSQTETLHLADLLSSHDERARLGFAFLRSRPGDSWLTSTDRAWAEALYDAAHQARVRAEVVHLATDDGIRPVLPEYRATWGGA